MRTADHELSGRIKRRGCAATDHRERHDAPQGERPTEDCHGDAGILHHAKMRRSRNPGSLQYLAGHEDEQETDEERRVCGGPG
jgi:hypothetical protein